MNEQTIKLMETLINTIGSNTDTVVNEYTKWHYIDGWSFIILGIMLCIGGVIFYKVGIKTWNEDTIVLFLAGVIIVAGLLFITANISDVMEPKAIAIHQLIKDIKQ